MINSQFLHKEYKKYDIKIDQRPKKDQTKSDIPFIAMIIPMFQYMLAKIPTLPPIMWSPVFNLY